MLCSNLLDKEGKNAVLCCSLRIAFYGSLSCTSDSIKQFFASESSFVGLGVVTATPTRGMPVYSCLSFLLEDLLLSCDPISMDAKTMMAEADNMEESKSFRRYLFV